MRIIFRYWLRTGLNGVPAVTIHHHQVFFEPGTTGDDPAVGINGPQVHIHAGFRWLLRQGADLATRGIDLHLLEADHSVQRRFIGLLDPVLADVAGARVIGDVYLFHVALADTADIAQHMCGLDVVRVVAQQLGLDVHAWKPVAMPILTGGISMRPESQLASAMAVRAA